MNKIKVVTIVGTRPEIIKLSEVIKKCDKYFDHTLVHTGQNYDYELNNVFFNELSIREPDYYLGVPGKNLGETMGNVLASSYELLNKIKPDALLVLGDTNSCLCVISAKRLKIPVFHMEAGNRCKDENLPEEVIRRIVDVTSDINMCYSENARQNILRCGVKPEYTFVVGSPMYEILNKYIDQINNSDVLKRMKLEKNKYILLSAHREENIDNEDNFISLMNSINKVAKKYKMPIIYSCHPRSKNIIKKRKFVFDPLVKQHKPLGFFDYCKLQQNAYCVISDSGTLPEESSYFKYPAVSIRTSTERQEAIEGSSFIIGSIDGSNLIRSIDLAVSINKNKENTVDVPSYNNDNVSVKVIKIIQSYHEIVDRFVWRKDIK